MKRTKIDLDALASLSGLSLSNSERLSFERNMEELISFADRIKDFNGSSLGKEPFFVHSEKDVLRNDVCRESLSSNALLSASAEKQHGYISVPEILSDKGADK
ncbi:MAG: hypothetical protein E7607_07410 [Ruminococcaceae bacterium]|nr:hypothetical protein [Oscillospiraceae bacterium]